MRRTEEPTRTESSMGGERGYKLSHPAFGQIGASRVSGSATLYGSDFVHHSYVRVTVSRSELHRELSNDWTFGRGELVEIDLSEAQWATFVSSLNVGSGTQCTIRRVQGEIMPDIPLRDSREEYHAEVDARARAIVARVVASIARVQAEKGLSQKKRDELTKDLQRLRTEIESNLPFVVRSHGEHMEAVVERAKTEVNAYMQNVIARTGIAALQEARPLEIAPPKDETNA